MSQVKINLEPSLSGNLSFKPSEILKGKQKIKFNILFQNFINKAVNYFNPFSRLCRTSYSRTKEI